MYLFYFKVLRVLLHAIHKHLYYRFYSPSSPMSKNVLKLVCNVNIVYRNLKSRTLKFMPRNLNEVVRS
jgi:hypothetical protein